MMTEKMVEGEDNQASTHENLGEIKRRRAIFPEGLAGRKTRSSVRGQSPRPGRKTWKIQQRTFHVLPRNITIDGKLFHT
jgi:hypothetical protein